MTREEAERRWNTLDDAQADLRFALMARIEREILSGRIQLPADVYAAWTRYRDALREATEAGALLDAIVVRDGGHQ